MVIELAGFSIDGLFGQFKHDIDFRKSAISVGQARVVVIVGPNGIGKTTILNMIEGMLSLDFSIFRRVPFKSASLELSNGDRLSVQLNAAVPSLEVSFKEHIAHLSITEVGSVNELESLNVDNLRAVASPILSTVSFQKVDIHRSSRDQEIIEHEEFFIENPGMRGRGKMSEKQSRRRHRRGDLSERVRMFVRDAQVDYRKFFTSSSPELFPRILNRLNNDPAVETNAEDLVRRLVAIKSTEAEMARFGLAMNATEIDQLTSLLEGNDPSSKTVMALALLEVFLETLESKHDERELISSRLRKFEDLITEFFVGKTVKIDYQNGLSITTRNGQQISELELSSGEYHLLYMMVTALVSTRSGTAIAIDEPELSLHIGWQRSLIRALVECSAGASPLFIFATHAPSISSEYMDQWVELKEGING